MSGQAHRVVAIANGAYARLRALDRAVPDTVDLLSMLRSEHGFDDVLLADLPQGVLLGRITGELGKQSLAGGVLVVLWIGHGEPGPGGELLLMGRADDERDDEVATARQLGAWAARTGASQVLVIVDTCFSGAGVTSALAMADAVIAGRNDPGAAWFGVVAASRADETSLSGALPRELKRLLTEGPKDERLRLRWGVYDARVRGDDVIDALLKEWSEPRHSPQQASTGNAWPMLRNPLYRPKAQHHVVEHLLQAARGTSRGTSGSTLRGPASDGPDDQAADDISYFTGREPMLARIVAWIDKRAPGTCVVTGPAGTGKSAILGRIASLSDGWERARLLAQEDVPAPLDPGEGTVSAQLHCRGMDTRVAVESLAGQLELDVESSIYDILGLAARRRREGRPLLFVLDGLDEAGDTECRNLALELVQPLSREALVLVGTRDVHGGADQPTLLMLLGATADTINLALHSDETMRDVGQYVVRRLRHVSPHMDPEVVAEEIVRDAAAQKPTIDGPFLLARLVTSQLRDEPVDTTRADWKESLATSVETALERDLERTVLIVGEREHPTAARELMRALACALGSGFPADDVWPAVATAISASGTTYHRDDVYALLAALGRHVVAGSEGDQGVFRIAHQRLVDHLQPSIGSELGRRLPPDIALPVATAIASLYESLLDQGQSPKRHSYLWRYAWRHLSDAGPDGITMLRRLVERDRAAFLPDLAIALTRVGSSSFLLGSSREAIAMQREVVEIRRELERPIDLAMALFDLSFALGSAGEFEDSDEAATDASEIARAAVHESTGRQTLAAALRARALSQVRRGNARASLRAAEEAIALLEPDLEAQSSSAPDLATALYLAAQTAQVLGDPERADTYSRRAVQLLDADSDESAWRTALLVDALTVRAMVEATELSLLQQRSGSVALPDTRPRPLAAERAVTLYRESGSTGTIFDITAAKALRLLAVNTVNERALGWLASDAPDPLALLNEAAALVEPLASGSADALAESAVIAFTRVPMVAERDMAQALADLADLERMLRASAPSVQLGALLGATIDMSVHFSLASGGDPASAIDREREAITLITPSTDQAFRIVLANVWQRLLSLLSATGGHEGAAEATERAVVVYREVHDGSAQSTIRLAATLSDLSFHCSRSARVLEALAYADEALNVLAPFGATDVTLRLIIGGTELNRSVALMSLERDAEAREGLMRALAMLDEDPVRQVCNTWIGSALYNLSCLDLNDGEVEQALARSTRAIELLEPSSDPAYATVLALSRINRGRALRDTGDGLAGTDSMNEGLAKLRAIALTDESAIATLAMTLNRAGATLWEEVLADLADEPRLSRELQLLRVRPVEQFDETVRLLHAALEEADAPPDRIRTVRSIARRERARAPQLFDGRWADAIGTPPDWLCIEPSLEPLVIAWWNTSSWLESRAYIAAHLELLQPGTDVLLEELREAGHSAIIANAHLRVLARARTHGVDAAYAPLLAETAVDAWSKEDYSSEYLTDHLDELLSPSVSAWLAEQADVGNTAAAIPRGILTLTRRGEQYTAYRVRRDAAFAASQLEQARRADDAERLEALMALVEEPHAPTVAT